MGSSPGLRGGLVSRNAATISSTLLPSTPEATNSLALTFTTHDLRAMRMLLLEIDQEPKKKTARNIRAVHISRRLAFGTFGSAHRVVTHSGHRGVSCPV